MKKLALISAIVSTLFLGGCSFGYKITGSLNVGQRLTNCKVEKPANIQNEKSDDKTNP